jgi:hypothetical protein
MPGKVDQFADEALQASKQARMSHEPDDHKMALVAHKKAASAADVAGRPSLASTHIQQAAVHDRTLNDPDSSEFKSEAAHIATKQAKKTGKAADHKAAAEAHQDAAGAAADNGDHAQAMRHQQAQFSHENDSRVAAVKEAVPGPVAPSMAAPPAARLPG